MKLVVLILNKAAACYNCASYRLKIGKLYTDKCTFIDIQ